MGKQVLNEKFVSVPRGSEYFSFNTKNQHEEALFICEDERYELDQYIRTTESTIAALIKLREEHEKIGQMPDEDFAKLRDKHVSCAKMKWIKHIYMWAGATVEDDPKYDFISIQKPVVIQVIIDRLQRTKNSWELVKKERIKKWKKICKTNFEKALDNRSFTFKFNEKKELTHKLIMKDCKDRHNAQIEGKMKTQDLLKLFTLFKPCDIPFPTPAIEDEPITLLNPALHKFQEKLPTYRMQMVDDFSFELSWKILISVVNFSTTCEKSIEFIRDLLRYFFKVDWTKIDQISCVEFSESDRDILIGILAPQILNKVRSDQEEEELDVSRKDSNHEIHSPFESESHAQINLKDSLSFADLENQSLVELLELDWFTPADDLATDPEELATELNTNNNDNKTIEEKVETEFFIPYFTRDYTVMFGSPNYYAFFKWFYTICERVRLAAKILEDKLDQDLLDKHEEVICHYKNYKRALQRIKENKGVSSKNQDGEPKAEDAKDIIEDSDETMKKCLVKHRLGILIGISLTKFKNKLDSNTFEDLVRVFLGIKSFFFFTFDKLIHTTNKAFQAVLSDEYLKSKSFNMFKSYCHVNNRFREEMYLWDYKQNLQEMSSHQGYTIRLLFSPKSKSLCTHFFDIFRPYSDSHLIEELNQCKDAYAHNDNSDLKMMSGELEIPSTQVYLKRNKRKRGEVSEGGITLSQNISAYFSINCLKLRYSSNQTDIVIRNKRFKVSEELEKAKEEEYNAKLRRFRSTNSD